mmetsp:Transcript_3592/g.12638  ORF Transcript_3592/g.12638 Transcript_3592/m.12638 type:complete len:87 (+) Transcript_3592:368-628(+)
MGHLRAISQAHYCYWLSKDLSLFILDQILHQQLYLQDVEVLQDVKDVELHGPRAPRGGGGGGGRIAVRELSMKVVFVSPRRRSCGC